MKYKFLVGILISIFCLVLLLSKMDGAKILAAFSEMDWRYILPAVISTFISYQLRAFRWRAILSPTRSVSVKSLTAATIVGYMANNVLPARLGEIVRAHLLALKEKMPTSTVLATLVIDRLWDGMTVLLILMLTVISIRLPKGMSQVQDSLLYGGYTMLAAYIAVIAILFLLKRNRELMNRVISFFARFFPGKIMNKLMSLLDSFLSGISIASPRNLAAAFFYSILIWLFALFPVDLVMRSFGITLPIAGSMLILVFLVFAVMVPAAPGYLGTFHIACVYGLKAFSIQDEKGMSIAIILHAINFFPVTAAGFGVLLFEKVSLFSLKKEA